MRKDRISRGSVYYLPRPVPEADLAIMRRLDRLRSAHQSRFAERKAMIDREHDLPITKQAEVLRIVEGAA